MKFLVAMGEGEVRDSFFSSRVIEQLEELGEVVYNKTGKQAFSKEGLMEHIKDVDVLLSGWGTPRVDADVLAAANKLKVHAHTGGSVASYISKEEYDRGIIVLSGNDLFAQSVAEGCLVYTLTALRRMNEYIGSMKDGGWRPQKDFNSGLIGKKIGIVGFGAIAKYYVKLLQWFHPEILIYSKYMSGEKATKLGAKIASMEEIFETCEVISLHAALNEENQGMITKELLEKIQPGSLFVNTARAGLIDKVALYEELATERFHAIIDVYHEEPLPEEDMLRKLENVILLPHIAGPTFDMREKVVLRLIQDIIAIGKDEPYQSAIPYEYAIRMTVN